jgi:hypothetical protein
MNKREEYEEKISRYDNWKKLKKLWDDLKNSKVSDWPPGKALEYLIVHAFALDGADVQYPYSVSIDEVTGDGSRREIEQIDGAVYTGGIACLIECKDTSEAINIEAIAKLRNQLLRRPGATIATVFSTGGFTEAATKLSRFTAPQTILLWGKDEIDFAFDRRYFCKGLIAKYRACVEKGISDYNIRRGV